MHEYRIYFLDDRGHVEAARDILCPNDLDALDVARALLDGRIVELWQLDRRVAVLGKDGRAPMSDALAAAISE
jgi:hypothetical protein